MSFYNVDFGFGRLCIFILDYASLSSIVVGKNKT